MIGKHLQILQQWSRWLAFHFNHLEFSCEVLFLHDDEDLCVLVLNEQVLIHFLQKSYLMIDADPLHYCLEFGWHAVELVWVTLGEDYNCYRAGSCSFAVRFLFVNVEVFNCSKVFMEKCGNKPLVTFWLKQLKLSLIWIGILPLTWLVTFPSEERPWEGIEQLGWSKHAQSRLIQLRLRIDANFEIRC